MTSFILNLNPEEEMYISEVLTGTLYESWKEVYDAEENEINASNCSLSKAQVRHLIKKLQKVGLYSEELDFEDWEDLKEKHIKENESKF